MLSTKEMIGLFPLRGAVDIHAETATVAVARRAVELGLAHVVLKWPGSPDSSLTAVAFNDFFGGSATRFSGGVCLDLPVGGLNPRAVDVCAKSGGRFVWMPTVDARLHRERNGPEGRPTVAILDERGVLSPAAERVLDRVAFHGLILGTGHLDCAEVTQIVPAARARGIKHVVLNHPLLLDFSLADLESICKGGGVHIEHCYVPDHEKYFDVGRIVECIDRLEPECNLIADYGDYGIQANIADALIAYGVERGVVERMACDLPASLLQR
jgi:hypothetical protein